MAQPINVDQWLEADKQCDDVLTGLDLVGDCFLLAQLLQDAGMRILNKAQQLSFELANVFDRARRR